MTHWKRPWCWERLRAGEEGDDRGWDGWMASPTQWTCVWVDSGSWWWTGRPGMLRFMGSQRVGHDWATELNWTESKIMTNTSKPEINNSLKCPFQSFRVTLGSKISIMRGACITSWATERVKSGLDWTKTRICFVTAKLNTDSFTALMNNVSKRGTKILARDMCTVTVDWLNLTQCFIGPCLIYSSWWCVRKIELAKWLVVDNLSK